MFCRLCVVVCRCPSFVGTVANLVKTVWLVCCPPPQDVPPQEVEVCKLKEKSRSGQNGLT